MKLSQFVACLNQLDTLSFRLESGIMVPAHFHITELGITSKTYIDCGGTLREDRFVSFQLWSDYDTEHRLSPSKAMSIITAAAKKIQLLDVDMEVEYQSDTVGKYALSFDKDCFVLKSKQTACLAEDQCGIVPQSERVNMDSEDNSGNSTCAPGSGCC